MDKIEAKSVVPNEFWILQKNNKKVGQVTALQDAGYEVTINGRPAGKYRDMAALKKTGMFTFTELPKPKATVSEDVHGYPADGTAYNAVWNVQYGLPLYTQTDDSKSWFAAGYYKVNISGTWIVQYCPKLITLQRNEYTGPYESDPGLNQFKEMFE